MSFDDFPRDSFNSTLSLRPTVWPTLYRSHLSPHLRSRHESKSTAFFRTSISAPFVPSIRAPRILSIKTPHIPSFKTPYIPSIKAPYIPSIKAPRIPSIRAPSIPHRAIPGTTRYISPGEHWDKKQTGSASLNGRDEYLTSRNGVLLPLPHDESPMVLGSALQVRQESESVSSSEGHCGRVICSPRYLAGNSSQGCTTDPVSTEYTMSFPDWPHVSDTNESKGRPVDDFTIRGTTSATIPVAHVAMTAPAPSPLGSRQCENSPSVSFGCRRSSFAGASTTAIGDQAEDYEMQSTLPSPSIEMSADREWSSRHITSHNPHRAILQSSPSYEKAVRVARPKVQHLSPSLRACLMCQLHKRKCDYGYPGQDRDNTKLHSKNLPCTHCKQMEEKQKPGYPSALYCFYPKPCEKANNGCGRCGLLREQLLVGRPRSIWKDVKRKFRVKDQRWWRTHSQHTDSQRDPHSGRNPILQAM